MFSKLEYLQFILMFYAPLHTENAQADEDALKPKLAPNDSEELPQQPLTQSALGPSSQVTKGSSFSIFIHVDCIQDRLTWTAKYLQRYSHHYCAVCRQECRYAYSCFAPTGNVICLCKDIFVS